MRDAGLWNTLERPEGLPDAYADRCPNTMRSRFRSTSNWATVPKIVNTSWPLCEPVSMASVSEASSQPRRPRALIWWSGC